MPIQANFGMSSCPQERRIANLLKGLKADGYIAQNILVPDKEYPKMPNEHDIVLLVPWGAYSIESKRTEGIEKLKLSGNNPDEWKRSKWLIGDEKGQWHKDHRRRNARWTAWHKGQILRSFMLKSDPSLAGMPVQGVVVFSDLTTIEASANDSGVGGRWCKVGSLVDLIMQDQAEYQSVPFSLDALQNVFRDLEALPSQIGNGTVIHHSKLGNRRDDFEEPGCTIPVLCYDSWHELYEVPLETRIYDLTRLDGSNARFMVRMKRRLKALERAEDQCTIRVKDIEEWMDGYLVSYEKFDGLTLRHTLKEYPGGMSRSLAISLILNVAATVSRLHNRRVPILHLDIRPENVLLGHGWQQFGGRDHKLHGFSNPRMNRESITPMTSLGIFGDSFVAPEIRNPSPSERSTPCQDIFSLGALLAYCLMGERAYTMSLNEATTVRTSTNNKNLDSFISRSLSIEPIARFKDADEFIRVLAAQTK